MLAFVMCLTINSAPFSFFANFISGVVSAYTSESQREYYTNRNDTEEKKISDGQYPSFLEKYFSHSSNNQNIIEYYNTMFTNTYSEYVEEYLKTKTYSSTADGEQQFNVLYEEFLNHYEVDSLYDYYKLSTSEKYGTQNFISFVEYFVTHDISYTEASDTGEGAPKITIRSLFPYIQGEDQIIPIVKFYNDISNHIYKSETEIEDTRSNHDPEVTPTYDGMAVKETDEIDSTNFKNESISYLRFKKIIDSDIEKNIAIYTYDGKQNKRIAAIFAEDAPGISYYYYDDNEFVKKSGNIDEASLREMSAQNNDSHVSVYYFGTATTQEVINSYCDAHTEFKTAESGYPSTLYFLKVSKIGNSDLENNPLSFRKIPSTDTENYVEGIDLYYHYSNTNIPYEVYAPTEGGYQVYVAVDDINNISESKKALYDMFRFKVFNKSELNIDQMTKNNYVQIPGNSLYFTKICGLQSGTTEYENFFKIFCPSMSDEAKESDSILYFKYKSSINNELYYYNDDVSEADKYAGYTAIDKAHDYNPDDYVLVESSDSDYVEGLELYHKKVRQYFTQPNKNFSDYAYKTTDNNTAYEYEQSLTLVTDDLFEKHDMPNNGFYMYDDGEKQTKRLFIVVSEEEYNSTSEDGATKLRFKNIKIGSKESEIQVALTTEKIIEKNENYYVKLSDEETAKLNTPSTEGETAGSEATDFEFYYCHDAKQVNKIYIIDDKDGAKDNKVYKNLGYEVMSNDFYKENMSKFIAVESGDANYNANFKLYYKYDEGNLDIFVKNELRKSDADSELTSIDNALFYVSDNVAESDITRFIRNNIVVISSEEYSKNSTLYVKVTKDDPHYLEDYPNLYYKYSNKYTKSVNVLYIEDTGKDTDYSTFNTSADNFNPNDYDLVLPGEEGYTIGQNLYYKKIRKADSAENATVKTYQYSYYYFQSNTPTIALESNSYYLISFYVYTNGTYTYHTSSGSQTAPIQASFYAEDMSKILDNIKIEHISTNGEWQQYNLFIATDPFNTSSVQLKLYMGDENSIFGNLAETVFGSDPNAFDQNPYDEDGKLENYATGVVMFDMVEVSLINMTEYKNKSLNNVCVLDDNRTEEDKTETPTPDTDRTDESGNVKYGYDAYGNKVFAEQINNHNYFGDQVDAWNDNKFDDLFNFEEISSNPDDIFPKLTLEDGADGYSEYKSLWQYFISQQDSGEGNNFKLKELQAAYQNGSLLASIIEESTIDKTPKDTSSKDEDKENPDGEDSKSDEESKDDENKEDDVDDEDIPYINSTFGGSTNKVLKLENNHNSLTLGVVSNYFTLKQNQNYKITVWIYSPDKDTSAVIELFSNLKNASAQTYGEYLFVNADNYANKEQYTDEFKDEFGWIPVSIYVQGNSSRDMNCYLALSAKKDSTVYFDHITIENISYSDYSNADKSSSESDNTTYSLTLSPDFEKVENTVKNGFFYDVENNDNYGDKIDYTSPLSAGSWVVTDSSIGTLYGIVPTSSGYLSQSKNFYTEYAPSLVSGNSFNDDNFNNLVTNIYGVHSPEKIKNPLIDGEGDKFVQRPKKNTGSSLELEDAVVSGYFKMHSSSISLTSSKILKLTFEFLAYEGFNGELETRLYYTSNSVTTNLAVMHETYDVDSNNQMKWNKYTYYIATGSSSLTTYLEIGITNATGTCFIKNVECKEESRTLNEIRDGMVKDLGMESGAAGTNIYDIFTNVKFVNIADRNFSIHDTEADAETNTYTNSEYTFDNTNTEKYTTGKSGIAIASYYTSEKVTSWTVTIEKIEYYIKEVTDTESGTKTYELYSDSNFKDKVEVIDGKSVNIDMDNLKVTLGTSASKKDYDITENEKTNYVYEFNQNDEYQFGNVFIPASELKNAQSENVMIIANNYDTDFTVLSPKFSRSLSSKTYYALKIYVKTSSFEDGKGLKISVDAVSAEWKNIDTTKVDDDSISKTEAGYGFVCYQVLISTNSTISSVSVKFSLGDADNTTSGYAIISAVEFEQISTEKLFNEYKEKYKDSDQNIVKDFANESSSESNETADDSKTSSWATFFYVFSTILIAVVQVVAITAIIIKRHPIKTTKLQENDHERQNISSDGKKQNDTISTTKSDSSKTKSAKSKTSSSDSSDGISSPEGFV